VNALTSPYGLPATAGLLLVLLATGCSDGVGPPPLEADPSGNYVIETVNDRPLPFVEWYGPARYTLESGSLTLEPNGGLVHVYHFRIDAPGGVQTGTETETGSFTFDPDAGELALRVQRAQGDTARVTATLDPDRVTVPWNPNLRIAYRR
jgi:hypothetical protein